MVPSRILTTHLYYQAINVFCLFVSFELFVFSESDSVMDVDVIPAVNKRCCDHAER